MRSWLHRLAAVPPLVNRRITLTRRLPLVGPASLLFGALGHLYGAMVLVTSLDRLRFPALSVLAFVASLGLVVATVLLTRDGHLPNRWLAVLGAWLIAVDVAAAAAIDPERWSESALWPVGTGGVIILVFGLAASMRPVISILGIHAVTLLACLVLMPGADSIVLARAGLTVTDALMIPVLGIYGASLYKEDLRQRAVATRQAARSHQALSDSEKSEAAALAELAWLNDQIRPILSQVAVTGAIEDGHVAALDLAAIRLRRELTAGPERPGLTTLVDRRTEVDVDILDPDDLGARMLSHERAAVIGLLRHLATAETGRATVVVLPQNGSGRVTIHAASAVAGRLMSESAKPHLDDLGNPEVIRHDPGLLVQFAVALDVRPVRGA